MGSVNTEKGVSDVGSADGMRGKRRKRTREWTAECGESGLSLFLYFIELRPTSLQEKIRRRGNHRLFPLHLLSYSFWRKSPSFIIITYLPCSFWRKAPSFIIIIYLSLFIESSELKLPVGIENPRSGWKKELNFIFYSIFVHWWRD